MKTRTSPKQADQLYSFTDLGRILKIGDERLRELRETGQLLGPDIMVPGGGHKAARWSASRVAEIYRNWSAIVTLDSIPRV